MAQYGSSPDAHPAPTDAPASVLTAVKLIWASVALSLINAVVGFVLIDDIVDSVTEGTSTDTDAARTGAIVGLVIGLVIGVAIAALFAYFIRKGANWARIVYTVLSALFLLLGLFGIASQPPLLLVLTLIGYALTIAILYFLYRPDSNAYFKKDTRFAA